MNHSSVIDIRHLSKTYNTSATPYEALRDVSFTVSHGELVAITGSSGSGKSTLMHILGLLDLPTSGQYHLEGQSVQDLNADTLATLRNQKIGFVFQHFFLLPKLTALENVCLPLLYRSMDEHEQIDRAMASLASVGMSEFSSHTPSALSGGQQQRVAIARALVGEPDIILADEPTGALDTKNSDAIMELLLAYHHQKTVLIITHDPQLAKRCPRVIEIMDGSIRQDTQGSLDS